MVVLNGPGGEPSTRTCCADFPGTKVTKYRQMKMARDDARLVKTNFEFAPSCAWHDRDMTTGMLLTTKLSSTSKLKSVDRQCADGYLSLKEGNRDERAHSRYL